MKIKTTVKHIVAIITAMCIALVFIWYIPTMGQMLSYSSVLFVLWLWSASLAVVVITLMLFGEPKLLQDVYYNPKAFEIDGRVYKILAIKTIKNFTVNGKYFNKIVKFFNKNHRVIHNDLSAISWEKKTYSKELGHLIHGIIMIPIAFYYLALGWYNALVFLLILCILFDVYPIMIQRYNRMRIKGLIQNQLKKRKKL